MLKTNNLYLVLFVLFVSLLLNQQNSLANHVKLGDFSRVNVLDFKSLVEEPEKENENWQPAIQAAIKKALNLNGGPVYFPAGKYQITKTIVVPVHLLKKEGWFGHLAFVGDGPRQSVIVQNDASKNVLDWTGPDVKASIAHGSIRNIGLSGGKNALNIQWHNQFRLDNCYIQGCSNAGIIAEGYSSSFTNVIIRWCRKYGILGRGHFNDITIRDGYFSRNGIGIYLSGGHGIRINGIGFENCANTGIFANGILGLSITNCYFERNGIANQDFFKKSDGFPSSIYINRNVRMLTIEECIFRGTTDNFGHISLVNCIDGSIRKNVFQYHYNGEVGLLLRSKVHHTRELHHLERVYVENNHFTWASKIGKKKRKPPSIWYKIEKKYFMEKAIKNGCRFQESDSRNRF